MPLAAALQRALRRKGYSWRIVGSHVVRDPKGKRVFTQKKVRSVSPRGALNHCKKRPVKPARRPL